ncbi:cation-translocating P-type ATPase [Thermaerobacter sp. FW80]|uniref:heavy metal translocating P-type ATPase n=1 Tax=Thermaerobacter sp. FW80 TaxID=2546351 RepID=UPI001FA95B0E|nr:cation-translocating P-type ATPase [Thermaerobacter sp. FW80]
MTQTAFTDSSGLDLGAVLLGQWFEAAFLVFLYGLAEGLEEYTFARTRSAIKALLDLAPKEARLLENGRERMVPASSLKPGDRFLVRPGESIATDAIIREGRSSINEAAVTGESVPVAKGPGDRVFAGTVNGEGALVLEATATFEDNTLSKIIRLVEQAQSEKGRAQRFIERFGRRYSPVVLLAAVALVLLPPLIGLDWSTWATRAVVLLVAAAPCALVMSTPVAMASAIGTAGKNGVLIKGGIHLENLGTVRAVALDKTGTLTRGEPVVTTIVAAPGWTEREVLARAAAIERFSEHPLARAVMAKAQNEGIEVPEAGDFQALPGAGARAVVGEVSLYVGSPALFQQLGARVPAELSDKIDELRDSGHTVVFVGTDDEVKGLLAIRDEIRPEAKDALQALREAGIEHFIMLTGDNQRTANAIARELGIDDVRAELKPDDKARIVKALAEEYGGVIMVGDGINDAPALAAATVGMAMGTAGTDAAIEAADVALMADDLRKVAYAVRLGRRARAISRQNIIFSLAVLAILIPGALTGWLGVTLAVAAHEVSELLAVANGLRAR